MALWSRPEPPEGEPAATGAFEGRTAEEALERARGALGPSAELRCWKTRRGGIGGFFATEVFVASVSPPAGALAPPSKGMFRRTRPAKDDAGHGADEATDAGDEREVGAGGPHAVGSSGAPGPTGSATPPEAGPPAGAQDPPGDKAPPMITYERPSTTSTSGDDDLAASIAALAAGTTDQLSLDFESIPSHSFDEVLAEAEATVAGVTAWSDRPGPSVQMAVAPPDEDAPTGGRVATPADPEDGSDRVPPPEDRMTPPPAPAPAPDGTAEDRREPGTGTDGPDAGSDVAPARAAAPAPRSRRARPKGASAPRTPRRTSAPATGPATPAATRPTGALPAPQPIPDLFERLRSLGVPEVHLPDPERLTLDAVARSMDGLPEAPPLPTAPGSVVAVVGSAAAVARTVRLLSGAAPFLHGPRPDPSRRVWAPEDRTAPEGPTDDVLQVGDPLEVAGRVARRRLDGRPSLVAVEVTPGHLMRSHDRTVIASVQPDYVLGAIDASVKRADAARWRDDLGVVDALALWGLDGTVSPAELLGVLPVAFVDGVPGTPVTWTLNLLQRAAEDAG